MKKLVNAPAIDLAENIIRVRRARGLSQAELAERMRTKQPQIARIESGSANVRLSTLSELAEALDAVVTIDVRPVELTDAFQLTSRWWHVDGAQYAFSNTDWASECFSFDTAYAIQKAMQDVAARVASESVTWMMDFAKYGSEEEVSLSNKVRKLRPELRDYQYRTAA